MKPRRNNKKYVYRHATGDNADFTSARAGVSLRILKPGQRPEYMFVEDHETSEASDAGGGVKRGETLLQAAYREFHEETSDIFRSVIGIDNMKTATCISNRIMSMFIVDISEADYDKCVPNFTPNNEVSGLFRFTQAQINSVMNGDCSPLGSVMMYRKVKQFITGAMESLAT